MARDAANMETTRQAVTAVHAGARVAIQQADLGNLSAIEPAFAAAAAAVEGEPRKEMAPPLLCIAPMLFRGVPTEIHRENYLHCVPCTRTGDVAAWRASTPAAASAPVRAVLVNNVGTLGEMRRIDEWSSVEALRAAIDLNVTGVAWLTSLFLRHARALPREPPAPHLLVNVSSLAALEPFATQVLYCTGKAARDMLHAGVAAEHASEADKRRVAVLNYAPGPLDTDMQAEIRASDTVLPESREFFIKMHAEVRRLLAA
jgi:NAD(P)-dependent dehydrogenase (short-subunit alcohol dehydrogenase family)